MTKVNFKHVMLPVLFVCGWLVTSEGGAAESKPAQPPGDVLAMDGPGGRVRIGDALAAAKKAYPAPAGAMQGGARNYAIFQRPGWSWATEKPLQAFEVSLKDDKIAGIILTMGVADDPAFDRLLARSIEKIGEPTAKALGKSAAAYAWDVKPHARFLVYMRLGFFSDQPLLLLSIGEQEDLKMFNYRVDDLETLVKQLDMGAEAMEKIKQRKKQ